jgi:hypothetical protein
MIYPPVPERECGTKKSVHPTSGYNRQRLRTMKRLGLITTIGLLASSPYLLKPWYRRWGIRGSEATGSLPGDEIVSSPRLQYTLAVTVDASPSDIWPWLVQLGRGSAGFYSYRWIEQLVEADNKRGNGEIINRFQKLKNGDKIWLSPDPALSSLQGQYLVVDQIKAPWTLVFRQILPDDSAESWAFSLDMNDDSTRLVFRRRRSTASLYDRLTEPGYMFMDLGMLHGIRRRAEEGVAVTS